MKITARCGCPDILQNGRQDSRNIYRVFLGAHLVKKQLHVLVLDAVACLIEVKMRFELTWQQESLMRVSLKEKEIVSLRWLRLRSVMALH
jgi:hypothetical protein